MSVRRDRVLFIAAGQIGDAVLASGLLARFVERQPDASFTVAAGPAAAKLFADTPRLEDLIPIVKQPYKRHWLDLWRRVGGRRWKAVIDTRGSALAYLLWAERRWIHRKAADAPGAPPLHKVVEAARVIGAEADPPAPFLYVSAATQARADALIEPGAPVLALAPATHWPPKTWLAERFAETAAALIGGGGPLAGARVLLTGAPGDRAICDAVRAALPPCRVIDAVGLDVLTTYACFKRVRLFVGNDSGPMHIAAAAGAPTLGLFGPTDDRRYRPWGAHAAYVRTPRPFADYPALLAAQGRASSAMTDLDAATVVAAACDLLERMEAAAPSSKTTRRSEGASA